MDGKQKIKIRITGAILGSLIWDLVEPIIGARLSFWHSFDMGQLNPLWYVGLLIFGFVGMKIIEEYIGLKY